MALAPFLRPRLRTMLQEMSLIEPLSHGHLASSFLPSRKEAPADVDALWPSLSPLVKVYPDFREWYFGKVASGIARGERRIICRGPAHAPDGIAIAKRTASEVKICTVWVSQANRNAGLGRDLLEEAIDWCGDAHPLFTVPAERYSEFAPLMSRFGFNETAQVESLYRLGVVEHIFNGRMLPSLAS